MSRKLPWRKWFAADWLSELQMAKCPAAGRGLWADALNLMLVNDTYLVSGTPEELARALRLDESDFCLAFNQLAASGLGETSVTPSGTVTKGVTAVVTIMSRRLEREVKHRENSRLRKQKSRQSQDSSRESCSASASASVLSSGNRGMGEGERPSREEVILYADKIGLAQWKAIDWFEEMEGCGWLDFQHRPIQKWQPVLNRVKVKWEADGRPAAPPSNGRLAPNQSLPMWKQLEILQEEIDKHPANPNSVYHRPNCTELERNDYSRKKTKLRELKSKGIS